ncbi:hypothetical protein ACOMHN_054790 [Nucella lapillus]
MGVTDDDLPPNVVDYSMTSPVDSTLEGFCYRSVGFLKHWPVQELSRHPRACMFHYFNRGQVLVRDSNNSDWIYIVKSGVYVDSPAPESASRELSPDNHHHNVRKTSQDSNSSEGNGSIVQRSSGDSPSAHLYHLNIDYQRKFREHVGRKTMADQLDYKGSRDFRYTEVDLNPMFVLAKVLEKGQYFVALSRTLSTRALERVAVEAEKIGLRINIGKTEILRFNNQQQDPVRLQQEEIKGVEKFTYLGSVVSKDGGADDDIKSRISKARHAFKTLQPIWQSSALSLHNKIRIFNTNVKSVLLYGSETWRTTKTNRKKLQTFINRCLRNILNIRWPEVISNEDLWTRTKQTPIGEDIRKRKWGWIGHTMRKPPSNVTRQALDWNPQGKRKVGRPRQTWRRSTEAEVKAAGMTWAELKRISQNRVRWRSAVVALCSRAEPEA